MLKNLEGVILAAGRSTRFNTGKSKLIEKICGQEMIYYSTGLLNSLKIPGIVVVGYQKEVVTELIQKRFNKEFRFVEQTEQRGTGHAIMCTKPYWTGEHILIMNADTPLIKQEHIRALFDKHNKTHAAMTFITAYNIDPAVSGYGRVIENEKGVCIVEQKEYDALYKKNDSDEVPCLNAGVYILRRDFLDEYIEKIPKSAQTGEYYFTELARMASEAGLTVSTINLTFDIIRGVNTLRDLWTAEQLKKSELITQRMEQGVRFGAAQNVHIDLEVEIGPGTYIGTGVQLFGTTKIGSNCTIEAFSSLTNATLEDYVHVHSHSNVKNSYVKHHSYVGPFAHIKSNSTIDEHTTIGNFVEINRSQVGAYTKIKHMCYIGDAKVGKHVNIGAGSITCNFDGIDKHVTEIKDHAFIGSNTAFVAPVIIGERAYTAAGSVITQNVPENALAIARSRQINKEEYVYRFMQKKNLSKQLESAYIAATKTFHETTFNENL
jgi:bifunctional UDP-N-acetylglucosamine pyrophosphorylase/glucosamine-1-phosphate N-acetyltransferase